MNSTQMNAFMRLLQFLFSEEAALATGTADPVSIARERMGSTPSTPLMDSLMASEDEDISSVFKGLYGGAIDPITAKQELYSRRPDLDSSWINSAIDKAFAEMSAGGRGGGSAKKTKYDEAYLPDPLERYSQRPDMAPLLPGAAKAMAPVEQQLASLRSLAPSLAESGQKPKSLQSMQALRDVFSGVKAPGGFAKESKMPDLFAGVQDEGIRSRLDAMSRSEQLKLYAAMQQKKAEQVAVQRDIQRKNAASLDAAGRTPTQDALFQRLAGLYGSK
jgi:hypothetical protein